MDDGPPASPPLARGTYNFNFDDLDDSVNPFQSSRRLDNSPERDKNNSSPFQSKSKLSSSPPANIENTQRNNNNSDIAEEEADPFTSKSKLGSSPPNVNNDGYTDNDDSFKTAIESPVKGESSGGLKTRAKSSVSPLREEPADFNGTIESGNQDGGSEAVKKESKLQQPKATKSTPSQKKTIKKPKVRSKFKPPANFGAQEADGDVMIFAPPPPPESDGDANATVPPPPPPEQPVEEDAQDFPPPPPPVTEAVEPETVPEPVIDIVESEPREPVSCENLSDLPNQMPGLEDSVPSMIESVHDFGAGDMPIGPNEGFVPASEVFNEDDEAWAMMEKLGDSETPQSRDSLYTKFDPLTTEQVPDKATPTRRVSDSNLTENCHDEDLLLMSTPPAKSASGRAVSRHPAARALQDQVEGDGAPREAHQIDKMLFSPGKGDGKHEEEVYFDARDYPSTSPQYRAQQGDGNVERMNAANVKKHGNSGGDNQDSIVQLVQVLKYSQTDWNRMKQELELDYNARILNKEREWSRKLADRDKRISHLDDQVQLLRTTNEDMRHVVAEFEKTIAQLQAEKLKTSTESQQSHEDLIKERDQALEDLQSVETAFSDLHQRYERTKGVVEGLKKNEDILKKCVQDYQVKVKNAEEKVVTIRDQAEDKLDQASQEIDKVRKATTAEVARLEAALKKSELKIQGLDRSLEQKIKENHELTAICDELISKVGGD